MCALGRIRVPNDPSFEVEVIGGEAEGPETLERESSVELRRRMQPDEKAPGEVLLARLDEVERRQGHILSFMEGLADRAVLAVQRSRPLPEEDLASRRPADAGS